MTAQEIREAVDDQRKYYENLSSTTDMSIQEGATLASVLWQGEVAAQLAELNFNLVALTSSLDAMKR